MTYYVLAIELQIAILAICIVVLAIKIARS